MKLTFTFEDITEEEYQDITNKYIDTRLYFSKRMELVKQGEMNIKRKLIPIIETINKELDLLLYEYVSYEGRFNALQKLMDKLKDEFKKVVYDD